MKHITWHPPSLECSQSSFNIHNYILAINNSHQNMAPSATSNHPVGIPDVIERAQKYATQLWNIQKKTAPTGAGNGLFTISGVVGEQVTTSSANYVEKAFQYATSSYQARTQPALIVYAKGEQDVVATINYARQNSLAVAVRTGGHQYSGASSTVAPNIQLDLSQTFRDPAGATTKQHLNYNEAEGTLRAGVSHSLKEFNKFMGDNKIFVPHGQCVTVHLGGHVQSGGYGQLGRSFGLLADHVTKLEIINYKGEAEVVTKESNPDMFFAVLGGSPGNFCVLKHFTIKIHKDQDYSSSMGLKCMFFYDKGILKRLLKILAKMSDDKDFPRNYDLCVNVVSSRNQIEKYFPGILEPHNGSPLDRHDPNAKWPRFISVWAQWVPLPENMNCDLEWFRNLADGCDYREDITGPLNGNPPVTFKPMSVLSGDWLFQFEREFEYPYFKSTHVSDSHTLIDDAWPNWLTNRIDSIIKVDGNGCYLSCQLQAFGGSNSMFYRNKGNGTCHSWRDSTLCATLDCFYDPKVPTSKATAEAWHKQNEAESFGPNGYFSKKDLRVLWGSYGGYNLHDDHATYYDDQTYARLAKLRAKFDPEGTFTPNTFCVKAQK